MFVGVTVCVLVLGMSAVAQDLAKVNVILPNDSSCGLFPQTNARWFGFWASSGVEVNFLPYETTIPYVAFLESGDADIAMLNPDEVLQAVSNNVDIRVIYETEKFANEGIIVRADNPARNISTLKNVTIGLSSDRDLINTIVALSSIGETLDGNNIKTVVVGNSVSAIAEAFQDGVIDAFAGGLGYIKALESRGVKTRSITPRAVSGVPGNVFAVWGPSMDKNRAKIEGFLRGWAMAQHGGVIDTKLSASACQTAFPEQFEDLEAGLATINQGVYVQLLARSRNYGELQDDVWTTIQKSAVLQGSMSNEIAPDSFLDSSFIGPANDWTLDDVKAGMAAWKADNADRIIN